VALSLRFECLAPCVCSCAAESFNDPAAFEDLLRALVPLISATDMQASQASVLPLASNRTAFAFL
jgi:hypothetical protein